MKVDKWDGCAVKNALDDAAKQVLQFPPPLHLVYAFASFLSTVLQYINCNCNQTFIKCHSVIQRCSQTKSMTNKTVTNKTGCQMLSEHSATKEWGLKVINVMQSSKIYVASLKPVSISNSVSVWGQQTRTINIIHRIVPGNLYLYACGLPLWII